MNRGRRNLKQAAPELEECQSIAQVVLSEAPITLRSVELIFSLTAVLAKVRESMWIRRGSFVVIDHTGKEKAQESGSKITSIVCKVLYYEQVLSSKSSLNEIFRDIKTIPADESSQIPIIQEDGGGEIDLSDESNDGMPPLKQTQKD